MNLDDAELLLLEADYQGYARIYFHQDHFVFTTNELETERQTWPDDEPFKDADLSAHDYWICTETLDLIGIDDAQYQGTRAMTNKYPTIFVDNNTKLVRAARLSVWGNYPQTFLALLKCIPMEVIQKLSSVEIANLIDAIKANQPVTNKEP